MIFVCLDYKFSNNIGPVFELSKMRCRFFEKSSHVFKKEKKTKNVLAFAKFHFLIRFQNIAANDAVITSKINTMSSNGWELAFVSSAVESDAGKNDGKGIFITRYIFKKLKE